MNWSDDPQKVEHAHTLWHAGEKSTYQIATELRITKNQLIGYAHRCGWMAKKSPIKRLTPEDRAKRNGARGGVGAALAWHLAQRPRVNNPPPLITPARTCQWTPEMDAKLTAGWLEGLTTPVIGKRIGVGKNAVIGRARRLGLPRRLSPIRAKWLDRTPETIARLKSLRRAGRTYAEMAEDFGVSRYCIDTAFRRLKKEEERAAKAAMKRAYAQPRPKPQPAPRRQPDAPKKPHQVSLANLIRIGREHGLSVDDSLDPSKVTMAVRGVDPAHPGYVARSVRAWGE